MAALTRPSCHRFRANHVRLWLSVITSNLGNLWRRLALPTRVATWSPTSLQQRLVKSGGWLIKHARYYWLLLAEGHLTRRLFAGMLRKTAALPALVGQPTAVVGFQIDCTHMGDGEVYLEIGRIGAGLRFRTTRNDGTGHFVGRP